MEEVKTPPPKPIYSGQGKSGICTCGHRWDQHHLMMVAHQSYVAATNECFVPCECEHYGFNERGGLGPDGSVHCMGYVDKGKEHIE